MRLKNTKAGGRRRRLVEKAVEDEAFRTRPLADPKAAIEEEPGLTPPPRGALSDEQLTRVAGGWGAILPPGRANAGGWF